MIVLILIVLILIVLLIVLICLFNPNPNLERMVELGKIFRVHTQFDSGVRCAQFDSGVRCLRSEFWCVGYTPGVQQ